MMQVEYFGGHAVGLIDSETALSSYRAPALNFRGYKWADGSVRKSQSQLKLIRAPYDLKKLLNLTEECEYHGGCVDAYEKSIVQHFKVNDSRVAEWFKKMASPSGASPVSLLREFVRHYQACGNGMFLKVRNRAGEWVGLERLLPFECVMVENYDAYGFPAPDYLQYRNYVRTFHPGRDVIHLRKTTHRSWWGISSLPVVLNVEILKEIKRFDYNQFKQGLLIDYIIVVEGGSLEDTVDVVDENGEVTGSKTVRELIRDAFREAQGNAHSHGNIIIESDVNGVKINLQPLRRNDEGGFIHLKKDLREGIFAYHRVPPRLVSQITASQLGGGGEVEGQMKLFQASVAAPVQSELAWLLAQEFKAEFGWEVDAESAFDFGKIDEVLETEESKLFREVSNG